MARLAELAMYDLPAVQTATDGWWQGLAAAFRQAGVPDVPERLSRGDHGSAWLDPDLLLAQSCGYPLVAQLAGRVRLIGTPHYAAPGCVGPSYCSLLVVQAGDAAAGLTDLRGRVAAVNGPDSLSGFHQLRAMAAPLAEDGRFFSRLLVTGSHVASVKAVQAGDAAVAAIDAVTHTLLARHEPSALAGTRVLGPTPPAPGLPYITAAATPPALLRRLRAGLAAAFADPALAPHRDALLLTGWSQLPAAAYRPIRALAARGAALADPLG